jgi:hypothetical protein
MSIGNLKTYGNKGNNFPFQLKVLQGITDLITAITGVSISINPQVRATNVVRTSAAGSVSAGKYSVSFGNVGAANGTVKGVTLKPFETINFDAGTLNNTLDAIGYDATGTDFLIIYLS